MDLSQLNQLKQTLCVGTKFNEIMHAFFDITDQPGFFDCGQRVFDAGLQDMVQRVAERMLHPQPVKLQNFLGVLIDEYHFTHAGGMINGSPLQMFYFSDIDKGLLAVLMSGGMTQFARITRKPMAKGAEQWN